MRSRAFAGYLLAQALGAFNDNAFKLWLAAAGLVSIPLAGALFILPFILFSTYAGWAADRWSKRGLIVAFKAAEVALMLAAVFAKGPALLALVFLMGVHSAFFAPVKLAVLPELVEESELSDANGLVQLTTFSAIILGTIAAGTIGRPSLFAAAAVLGFAASLLLPKLEAKDPGRPLRLNAPAELLASLRRLRELRGVHLATVGAAYFWFAAALLQMTLLPLGLPFQIASALGLGAGSALAGRLSRERVELGLVPMGALGLSLACAALTLKATPLRVALAGLSAGAFAVPLQAFIQLHVPAGERGRLIAVGNVLSFIGILIASAFYAPFHGAAIFPALCLMTLVVAGYIVSMLPDFLVRLSLYPLANCFYRIRTKGTVPMEGPVLLVSNHVSFIDAFLIAMASPRMVRFMMFRAYYDLPVVGWFFRAMKCIPVSNQDGPKAIIESFRAARAALERGEAVCIFAEGEISRHGNMLRFKKGFERIVEGLDVPIVPVHLDQVWGSVFSFSQGRVLFKKPRRIPYPVTVSFGRPLPATVDAFALRQAILELGSEAFAERLRGQPSLPRAFAREALRHPFRLAAADSFGMSVTYGGLFLKAGLAGSALKDLPGENVGVLLPPSVGGVIANVALSFAGKVPINLNYTASPEIVEACRVKADIKTVVTSRRFLEKLGWTVPGAVFLEDVKPRGFAFARPKLDDLATVMFTSGSTGIPKGVMLTHSNVLSNVLAVAQVYQLGPDDRLMGVLPFFHSFGFTATLWLPLISGLGSVYHYNPLDAKTVGDLVGKSRCTFLMGTPTFVQNYTRRVDAEKFKTLRCVVVGAEKLREEVAAAFEQKFGLRPLEGYGCTELSPVAAVNIPDIAWPGVRQKGGKQGTVGHPLPGVFMKVVDPNSSAELAADAPGLLLVKGPNVMKGYLGDAAKTADVVRDGFYATGDIAAIDADGFVTITDRLSRFSKIAGEMVPHIRVEEKLHEAAGLSEQTFVVTSVPDEKRGERLVVLHKPYDGLDALLKKLGDSGLPKLWLPDRFHVVQEFPLLGSGKLDLQRLKAVAKELDGAH